MEALILSEVEEAFATDPRHCARVRQAAAAGSTMAQFDLAAELRRYGAPGAIASLIDEDTIKRGVQAAAERHCGVRIPWDPAEAAAAASAAASAEVVQEAAASGSVEEVYRAQAEAARAAQKAAAEAYRKASSAPRFSAVREAETVGASALLIGLGLAALVWLMSRRS